MRNQTAYLENRPKIGFTLIEIAIVLMIIGFLAGGVFLGQSLIRQSQVISAGTDEQKYVQAAKDFMQKYNGIPGDLYNATSYWGAMSTCPPTSGMASPGGTLTCSGDGDGQIPWGSTEMFLFWQHLANASMIAGYYTGIPGTLGTPDHVIGQNCPASRIDGGGFSTQYRGNSSGSAGWYDGNYGYIYVLGAKHTGGTGSLTDYSLLTPDEMYNMDKKFDDGKPGTGYIRSYTSLWTSCVTTTDPTTSVYNMSAKGPNCVVIFTTGF